MSLEIHADFCFVYTRSGMQGILFSQYLILCLMSRSIFDLWFRRWGVGGNGVAISETQEIVDYGSEQERAGLRLPYQAYAYRR